MSPIVVVQFAINLFCAYIKVDLYGMGASVGRSSRKHYVWTAITGTVELTRSSGWKNRHG